MPESYHQRCVRELLQYLAPKPRGYEFTSAQAAWALGWPVARVRDHLEHLAEDHPDLDLVRPLGRDRWRAGDDRLAPTRGKGAAT